MAPKRHCSFCEKSQDEVKRLIAKDEKRPDGIHICNECVLLSLEVLVEEERDCTRYKTLLFDVRKLAIEDELELVDNDLLRLNAERDNLLHDIADLKTRGENHDVNPVPTVSRSDGPAEQSAVPPV